MNQLSREQRAQVLALQVEGTSVRATCRVTGRSKGAVLRLLQETGRACARAHSARVRDLPCQRVQVDEAWAFVGMKARNVPRESHGEFGIAKWSSPRWIPTPSSSSRGSSAGAPRPRPGSSS